jgi:hypothetical protein
MSRPFIRNNDPNSSALYVQEHSFAQIRLDMHKDAIGVHWPRRACHEDPAPAGDGPHPGWQVDPRIAADVLDPDQCDEMLCC